MPGAGFWLATGAGTAVGALAGLLWVLLVHAAMQDHRWSGRGWLAARITARVLALMGSRWPAPGGRAAARHPRRRLSRGAQEGAAARLASAAVPTGPIA
jgi:hypothetical protein